MCADASARGTRSDFPVASHHRLHALLPLPSAAPHCLLPLTPLGDAYLS